MKTHVSYPEGHVLLRQMNASLPIIDWAQGIYLYDKGGKRYIDASSGAMVVNVGHANSDVIEEINRQLAKVSYVNGNFFTTDVCEELSQRLLSYAEAGMDRAFFLSSGSEAVEAAIKFARQYHYDSGHQKKYKIIARSPGYHGNTLYALSASGRPRYKKYFGPLLSEVLMVQSPYPYRAPVENYERDGAQYYLKEIEELIAAEGADTIAAFLVEPVSGTSLGGSTPPDGYLKALGELCRRHNILVIADEVLCGAARTGSFFAHTDYELHPDLVVMGKGINSGYAPLSALLCKTEHLEVIRKASGNFMHAQTYINAPSALAAGLGVMKCFEKLNLVEKSKKMGAIFQAELRAQLADKPCVGHISGKGLLAGIELVANRESKQPFERSRKFVEKVHETAFAKGLVFWPNYGHVDGTLGDMIVLGPPLVIDEAQIKELVMLLSESLP